MTFYLNGILEDVQPFHNGQNRISDILQIIVREVNHKTVEKSCSYNINILYLDCNTGINDNIYYKVNCFINFTQCSYKIMKLHILNALQLARVSKSSNT